VLEREGIKVSLANLRAVRKVCDGSGSALYAGGLFGLAGQTAVRNIARWNGSQWSALGSGVGGWVFALTAFDDGAGAALFAAFAAGAATSSAMVARSMRLMMFPSRPGLY
jgi:hypothetical protein